MASMDVLFKSKMAEFQTAMAQACHCFLLVYCTLTVLVNVYFSGWTQNHSRPGENRSAAARIARGPDDFGNDPGFLFLCWLGLLAPSLPEMPQAR
jgi:hypothetical protein